MKRLLPIFLFAICGIFLTACQKPTDDEKIKQEYEQLIAWQEDIVILNQIAQAPFLRDGKCEAEDLKRILRGIEYCHLLSTDRFQALSEYYTLINQKAAELDKISTTTPLIKHYREKMEKAVIQQIYESEQHLDWGGARSNEEQTNLIDKEYTDAFIAVYTFFDKKYHNFGIEYSVLILARRNIQRVLDLIIEN